MKVRAMDINKVDRKEIDKFKGLFLKGNTNSKQTIENEEDIVKHNSYKKNGTYIRSMKVSGRRSINSTKEVKE